MAWRLAHKVCLNNSIVPLESKVMEFDNIHGIDGVSLEQQEQTFSFLALKATDSGEWLSKVFQPDLTKKKMARRWWSEIVSLPLLQEIRQAIAKSKSTKGSTARLPKRPNIVVAIEIRGQAILVLNQTRNISLAFQPGQELEGLQWFLEELEKDLGPGLDLHKNLDENLEQEDLEEESPDEEDEQKNQVDLLDLQLQTKHLQALRGHEQCLRASWPPSKPCYRVVNKDKSIKEFFVPCLKKRRVEFVHHGDLQVLETIKANHETAYQEALRWLNQFLDRPSGSAAASSSQPSSS